MATIAWNNSHSPLLVTKPVAMIVELPLVLLLVTVSIITTVFIAPKPPLPLIHVAFAVPVVAAFPFPHGAVRAVAQYES